MPCWGDRKKLPQALRSRLDVVAGMLRVRQASSGPRPHKGRDPKYPLMLGDDTPLSD
jgi:hypothetical protein